MRASTLGRAALAAGLALAGQACGDDAGGEDARVVDAATWDGPPDAEDLCPGQLTVEGQLVDLEDSGNLFDFELGESLAPTNTARSAPNGRAILCVGVAAEVDILATGPASRDRRDRVSAASMSRLRAAGEAHLFAMVTEAFLTTLTSELAVDPPDGSSTFVLVHVVSLPSGTPLVGATVAIDAANDGIFTRQADGAFVEGAVIAAGGAVMVVNATASPPPVVTIEPPDGFAGDCVGPSELAPEAAAVSGAVFACE